MRLLLLALSSLLVGAVSPLTDERTDIATCAAPPIADDEAVRAIEFVERRLCDGGSANLEEYTGPSELLGSELAALILEVSRMGRPETDSITIEGAIVSGDLDLRDLDVRGSLLVLDSTIEGVIDLSTSTVGADLTLSGTTSRGLKLAEADIGRSLVASPGADYPWIDASGLAVGRKIDLSGSEVSGPVIVSEARVSGQIELADAHVGSLHLESSDIGGSLDAPRLRADEVVSASGLKVENDVWLNEATARRVDFRWSSTRGSWNIDGGVVEDEIVLNSAVVGGVIGLTRITARELDLNFSNFETLLLDGSKVSGKLAAVSAIATTDVRLGIDSEYSEVDLHRIRVDREVRLYGATVDVGVDLRGSTIGGALSLAGPEGEHVVTWSPEARLDLRLTTIGSINDSSTGWPETVLLDGYRFVLPRGIANPPGEVDFIDRPTSWYVAWLNGSGTQTFQRQAFIEIEGSLRDAGRFGPADQIATARLDRERQLADGWRGLAAWIDWVAIGYGFKPWRALVFASLIWLTGGWFAGKEVSRIPGIGNPLMFSLDRLVPFVSFSKKHADVEISSMNVPARPYFYFHVASGYFVGVLMAVTVARLVQV